MNVSILAILLSKKFHRVPYAFCFNVGSASFHGSASLGVCLTPIAQQTNEFPRRCCLSIHFEQLAIKLLQTPTIDARSTARTTMCIRRVLVRLTLSNHTCIPWEGHCIASVQLPPCWIAHAPTFFASSPSRLPAAKCEPSRRLGIGTFCAPARTCTLILIRQCGAAHCCITSPIQAAR